MFDVLLSELHIFLVSLLRFLSSFLCLVKKIGLHDRRKLNLVLLLYLECGLLVYLW